MKTEHLYKLLSTKQIGSDAWYKIMDDFIDEQKHIKGHSVFLNVYYKSRVSFLLQYIGLGIFHTAVEINDNEYSFGYTNEGYCGIVVKMRAYLPRNSFRNLRDLLSWLFRGLLGFTNLACILKSWAS